MQVHNKEDQPLEVMKLLTIYVMETSRVICDYPMDTVCIVFNLENFTMANMVSLSKNPNICTHQGLIANIGCFLGLRRGQIFGWLFPSLLSGNSRSCMCS